MIIDNKNDLSLIIDRLIPEKFKGTTFESLVKTYLKTISNQHNIVNNFTNRYDITKLETKFSNSEINDYVGQYNSVLYDIINIPYQNLLKNPYFNFGSDYWLLKVSTSYMNKTAFTDITGNSAGTYKDITYSFDNLSRTFSFTRTEQNTNLKNYLIQELVFGGTRTKFEIHIHVAEMSQNSEIRIFPGVGFSYVKNIEPEFVITAAGDYTFRTEIKDFNEYFRNSHLIIEFNGNVKLKNISVREYDRIETEDINILASQLILNKGRISLYEFLFNLLSNLGDNSTDIAINIDEFDVTTAFTKPRISISEIYQYTKTNIVYDPESPYTFGGQDFYDAGYSFKEYVTKYDTTTVVPFKYKVDATFSQDMFIRYILPLAHPVGWDIIYSVYKLLECSDRYNISTSTEIDNSKYTEYLFIRKLSSGQFERYTEDVLSLPVLSTLEYAKQNLYSDSYTISSESDKYFEKQLLDNDTINSLLDSDNSKYFELLNGAYYTPENMQIENFQESDFILKKITLDYELYDASLYGESFNGSSFDKLENNIDIFGIVTSVETSVVQDYYRVVNDLFDTNTFIENFYQSFVSSINLEFDDMYYTNELVYGEFFNYDEGDENAYADAAIITGTNESISILNVYKYDFISSNTTANLTTNISIVKKIQNFGHGIDENFYLYKGVSGIVNLTTQNYGDANWFNLNLRQPV